jgi:hypothetical protein
MYFCFILGARRGRRAAAQISFKEPSLRDKMRQVPSNLTLNTQYLVLTSFGCICGYVSERDLWLRKAIGVSVRGWLAK